MDDIAIEQEALEHVFSDTSAEPIQLSYGLLRSVTEDFSHEIGRGGFGIVYMGYLESGKVAVKKLSNPHALPDKQFLGEITCLQKAKHKNIVRFLGYCSETQGKLLEFNGRDVMAEVHTKLLCFEYVPGGNIRHYLEQGKPQGDDWLARYQMIRGICHGLHCLHEKQINHLDLKPENVMLDDQMEPKITDFGLSRLLDQGQSKMVTEHIVGTPRYIAPEIIDKGEISFKSDIYALGIIIIELLTGISMMSLENWDESLNEDCPRVRRCTEIARKCTDADKHNRPIVREVISDLDELDGMIPRSSLNQATPTAFPGTELVDVYPLELRFPYVPKEVAVIYGHPDKMHCQLSVINKTDGGVYYLIIPAIPDRYKYNADGFRSFLPPMSTRVITLAREAEKELPLDTDKLEILMLITGCAQDVFEQQISMLSLDEDAPVVDNVKAVQELLGLELHRATLTAVVVNAKDEYQNLEWDTACHKDSRKSYVRLADVHPKEPWVLIAKGVGIGYSLYIWNMQTKESMGEELCPDYVLAKFIPRKQWVVIGNSSGSILVCTAPRMHPVMEIEAHRSSVTSLAVHPNRPFLLSSDEALSLKLWDLDRDWSCIGIFDVRSTVTQIMFNPKNTSTFATLHADWQLWGEIWRIGQHSSVGTMYKRYPRMTTINLFTYVGDQDFIAAIDKKIVHIWDLQKKRFVHTLHIEEGIVAVICHPTRPILVTASKNGNIRVWDSTTYRLKKAYVDLPKHPIHIGFTGSRRLVIGYESQVGIVAMDIDLE